MNISFKGDHVVRSSAMSNFPDPLKVSSEEYRERVSRCIHSEVRMLSCINNRTPPSNSKTVFNLPEDSGPGAAGGPCTYSILESLQRRSKCPSWTDLLYDMNIMLQLKGFDQIPQLSSTSDICLTTPFSILKDGYVAKKALFIGINYSGQVPGEIKGCHSDVDNMKKFILGQGYEAASCRLLLDDGGNTLPTKASILSSFEWLVHEASPGDSLFLHFSGHFGQLPGEPSETTLLPLDYQSQGHIRQLDLLKSLILTLPRGSLLTVVMDGCHFSCPLQLPFRITARDAVAPRRGPAMLANVDVDPALLRLAASAAPAGGTPHRVPRVPRLRAAVPAGRIAVDSDRTLRTCGRRGRRRRETGR